MSEEYVHIGYRQQQQPGGRFSSEIWNYYGLDFNHIEAKRRGFRVEKVFASLKDQSRQDYRKERRLSVIAKARGYAAWNTRTGDTK